MEKVNICQNMCAVDLHVHMCYKHIYNTNIRTVRETISVFPEKAFLIQGPAANPQFCTLTQMFSIPQFSAE